MGLDLYQQKRNFSKTPEPKGKHPIPGKNYYFVIQKHAASHLHYDFRLELDGVLKSWAIPKGPSLDPKIKRLAMHVEDHPIEYGSFEGIIPKGQYGGGTVMLWDKGHWIPLDADPKKAYEKGHLRFELNAHKLHGRWDLIHFKSNSDSKFDPKKSWFLVKYKDKFARSREVYDITLEKPNSVVSHQSLEDIAKNYENIWESKEGLKKNLQELILKDLKKQAFPLRISPQLATLVNKPPEGDQWLHEMKFDGYRIIAFKEGKTIRLLSRNNIEWTSNFPNLVRALKKLPLERVIFDGEVVLLDENNRPNFQNLQNAMKAGNRSPFIYYIFDLLYYKQFNLQSKALLERKTLLEKLLLKAPNDLQFSDHFIGQGKAVFDKACEFNFEGIISKNASSSYQEGRSKNWLKVKCIERQEFVIGGYSKPQGGRGYFGSLFLGVYDEKGELNYTGNVGTGFTEASLKEVYNELQKNLSNKNPFNSTPPKSKNAIWVKPKLVAEIEFSEWTSEGKLRHPSFKGLRKDKKATSVKREREKTVDRLKKNETSSEVILSNPNKIIFKKEKIRKADLFKFYDEISEYILPFIKNRLLTLVRCPTNYEDCFFQKHFNKSMTKKLCPFPIKNEAGESEQYLYLKNKMGLLSLIQMGVLEIHPWGSRIEKVENPDMIIIDLDPAPDVIWKKIVSAAFEVKKHLEAFGLTCFVKTTGGKGLHIVAPIEPEYPWDEVKNFTEVFVKFLEKINPETYTTNMAKSKRKGKIFADYLRNQRGATAISAYSTRARAGIPISTPIHWDELTDHSEDSV